MQVAFFLSPGSFGRNEASWEPVLTCKGPCKPLKLTWTSELALQKRNWPSQTTLLHKGCFSPYIRLTGRSFDLDQNTVRFPSCPDSCFHSATISSVSLVRSVKPLQLIRCSVVIMHSVSIEKLLLCTVAEKNLSVRVVESFAAELHSPAILFRWRLQPDYATKFGFGNK